jgi:uncharacterized membrane protein YfcA
MTDRHDLTRRRLEQLANTLLGAFIGFITVWVIASFVQWDFKWLGDLDFPVRLIMVLMACAGAFIGAHKVIK